MKKIKTRDLTMIAMFTAILCISAYISIPIPFSSSPLTLLNFFILLIGAIFPVWESSLILIVWILLGCIGLPVFAAGGAGIGFIISPKGGYYLGFLLSAIFTGLLRGKKYNRIRYTVVVVLSAVLIDALGTVVLAATGIGGENAMSIRQYIVAGFLVFLPLDIVKAVIIAQTAPAFTKILRTQEE